MKERSAISSSGWLALLVGLGALGAAGYLLSLVQRHPLDPGPTIAEAGALFVLSMIAFRGILVNGPNEARVLTLFGRYTGTVRDPGLRWANPFATKRLVSLRAFTFESQRIKVNDIGGNPIEIGAVVMWRVVDTARAAFDVEAFPSFVQVQADASIRTLAMHHPYDSHDDKLVSLRGNSDVVAAQLVQEINTRVAAAGVEVIDARIAHLAYAPEIAQAMLQRQQAGAIIAARTLIVEGAVSMVEMALQQLSTRGIVELDTERKAAMVSNLLVVLCGERGTQPVLNTGSLY